MNEIQVVNSKLMKQLKKEVGEFQCEQPQVKKWGRKIKNRQQQFKHNSPSAEELRKYLRGIENVKFIDMFFEYLYDYNCLNNHGVKLQNEFWRKYIKD